MVILGSNPGSDSNSALVVGTDSVWTNNSYVYIGNYGVGNSLVISNGGRVSDDEGLIGLSSSSSNNGCWSPAPVRSGATLPAMKVGYFGPGNSLVISNGGRVIDDLG